MKPFIVKIALFILLFLIVLTPFCLYRRNQLQTALQKEAILPSGTTTLVLGDSHTECSLDPAYFEGMANRSRSGENIFYSYAKAKYYFDANPTIHTLFLSYNDFRLAKWNEESVIGNGAYSSYPIYMDVLSLYPDILSELFIRETYKPLLTYYSLANFGLPSKQVFNEIALGDRIKGFHGAFLDEFKNSLDEAKLDERVSGHFKGYNPASPNEFFSRFELKYLHKLLSYATEQGIKVILFSAPCHPKYNERIPRPLQQYTDSLALDCEKRYGTTYINMLRYPLPDSLYLNFDHTNNLGAAVITPILRDSLIQLGVIENK